MTLGAALLMFSGCGKEYGKKSGAVDLNKELVGSWNCQGFEAAGASYDSESFKPLYGYDITEYAVFKFSKDGTGAFTAFGGEEYYGYKWEVSDEIVDVTFDNNPAGLTSARGEYSDQVLTLKMDLRAISTVFTLAKEGSASSPDTVVDGDKREKLRKANVNARLVYDAVSETCAELRNEGREYELSIGESGLIETAGMGHTAIERAVKSALDNAGVSSGYVCWEIDMNYNCIFAQYSENFSEGYVGQYPDPVTDISRFHAPGKKI